MGLGPPGVVLDAGDKQPGVGKEDSKQMKEAEHRTSKIAVNHKYVQTIELAGQYQGKWSFIVVLSLL